MFWSASVGVKKPASAIPITQLQNTKFQTLNKLWKYLQMEKIIKNLANSKYFIKSSSHKQKGPKTVNFIFFNW